MTRKIVKIIAGMIGFMLIAGLLFFVNAFVGNPISKLIAENSAKKYVEDKYSDIELSVEKSVYNFKFGSYMIFFRCPSSYDTAFSVYSDSFGKIIRDDYKYEVANNFTTWRRLDSELRNFGEKLMTENLPYNVMEAALTADTSNLDEDSELLVKDMEFDIHNLPFEITAFITVKSENVSYEKSAEVLKSMAELFENENIEIKEYDVRIEGDPLVTEVNGEQRSENRILTIYSIPAELLNSEDLAAALKILEES